MISAEPTKYLPHRDPFLWVSRLVERVSETEGTVEFDVSAHLNIFKGHFPGDPVFPGVLQIEAGAQACGWIYLFGAADPKKYSVLFVSVDSYRFKKIVRPDTVMQIKVNRLKKKSSLELWDCQIFNKTDGTLFSGGTFWLRLQANEGVAP